MEVAALGAHLQSARTTREELNDQEEKAQECSREMQDIAERTQEIEDKVVGCVLTIVVP